MNKKIAVILSAVLMLTMMGCASQDSMTAGQQGVETSAGQQEQGAETSTGQQGAETEAVETVSAETAQVETAPAESAAEGGGETYGSGDITVIFTNDVHCAVSENIGYDGLSAYKKEMESKGYQFEGADASFELLVKRLRGEIEPKFTVKGFKILMDNRLGAMDTEASIKVLDSAGELEQTAADGNGPVNALDKALRKSLIKFFPEINDMKLTDYKVRVFEEKKATASGVRVLIRSTDGKCSWTTVGVSENVVEASLIALVDAIEYKLMISKVNFVP